MMSMGQKLYELWATGMLNQGIQVDPWDAVPAPEQAAWEEVGEAVTFA